MLGVQNNARSLAVSTEELGKAYGLIQATKLKKALFDMTDRVGKMRVEGDDPKITAPMFLTFALTMFGGCTLG